MKHLYFIQLVFFLVTIAVAQEADTAKEKTDTVIKYYSLKGVVSEAEGQEELLPGVDVVLLGTKLGSTTNLKGQYLIKNIPQGIYTLRAKSMGYDIFTIENINVNNDSFINIRLWAQWLKDPDTTKQTIKKDKEKKFINREHVVVRDFVRPGLIKGTVVDNTTGLALYNVRVSVNRKNKRNTDSTIAQRYDIQLLMALMENNKRDTDSAGYYRFTNVPVGLYTIKVEKEGYKPIIKKNVKVKRSQMLVFDFKMVK